MTLSLVTVCTKKKRVLLCGEKNPHEFRKLSGFHISAERLWETSQCYSVAHGSVLYHLILTLWHLSKAGPLHNTTHRLHHLRTPRSRHPVLVARIAPSFGRKKTRTTSSGEIVLTRCHYKSNYFKIRNLQSTTTQANHDSFHLATCTSTPSHTEHNLTDQKAHK